MSPSYPGDVPRTDYVKPAKSITFQQLPKTHEAMPMPKVSPRKITGPIYRDLQVIGEGSFGLVCSAYDVETEERVAIKRLRGVLCSNKKVEMKQAVRELHVMRCLGRHDNIVTLRDAFVGEDKNDLYVVMDLMESDLMKIINSSQTLTPAHHRHFTKQLLEGVAFLHRHGVIHRDIKPSNLLVNRNCELKIGDFGLARFLPTNEEEPLSANVVTRFYRAPELMTSTFKYNQAVDMWSVGCVIGELLRRRPIFPGRSLIHQLAVIMEVIGKPSGDEVHQIQSYELRRFLASRPGDRKGKGIKSLFPPGVATPEALSLLHGLLVYSPDLRLTAEEALEHVYLGGSLTDSPTIPPLACSPQDLSYEHTKLTIRDLRVQLMKEVVEARKIKEKKLGMEPRIGPHPGGMVKSPRESTTTKGDEETQIPSWPTVTASSSWGEECWAEVDEERLAKAQSQLQKQEENGEEKKGMFMKWWSKLVGEKPPKPSRVDEEEKEEKPEHHHHHHHHPKDKKEEIQTVASSLLMALGGKGGAALGVGMMGYNIEDPLASTSGDLSY